MARPKKPVPPMAWEVLLPDVSLEQTDGVEDAFRDLERLTLARNALVRGSEQVDVGYGRSMCTHGVTVKVHKGRVIAEYDKLISALASEMRTILYALDLRVNEVAKALQ